MNPAVAALWSRTALLLWPADVMLASFAVADLPVVIETVTSKPTGFSALVVERDEVSLTLDRTAFDELALSKRAVAVAGPYRAITLDLQIDLGVSGYLLPAAERLAAAGISIVPQCAFQKDHLLVRAADAAKAMAVLGRLVEDARSIVEIG